MQIVEQNKIHECYTAVKDRDTSFIGSFFFGVLTTKIFCIPSCRARTPKPENVVFFTEVKELLDEGFRPCKLCKPTLNAYQIPEDISRALKLVHQSRFEKIPDARLLKENIRPEKVRRWFKKNYGMTFQAYQRMYRINTAYQEIKNGKRVTESAFNSGYESLSGFAYTFKTLLGKQPQKGKVARVVHIKRITTPLGPMFACASDKGLCLLEFTDRKMMETEFLNLQKRMNATILFGKNIFIDQAEKELDEYFNGKRKEFTVPLDLNGSDAHKTYWKHLQQVPIGKTTSYTQLSTELEISEDAIRSANGKNSIAIIVPCHRVISAFGDLVGYGGGLERKRWLITHEQKIMKHD